MIRRYAPLALLAGLLFGCQTAQVMPDPETTEKVEMQEQDGQPVAVDEMAEEQPKAVVEKAKEQETPAPVPVEEPIIEERTPVMILMKTSKGDIKIELDKEKAPKTVANFLSYVESGHYNGTIFHRVMDGFMIQGGGFDEKMLQKPATNTVENEAADGLKNVVGSIAMARTADPHSASAQFFINVNDNTFLDYPGQDGWGYCAFGQVVEGMDVVNDIKSVRTGNAGRHQNVPIEPVVIAEVVVVE